MDKDKRQMLTNSSLTAFKVCPRKYQLAYEQGIVPARDSEPLYFGRLMHDGLEAWSTNGRDIEAAVEHIEKAWSDSGSQDEYLLAKVTALLCGYAARYQDDGLEIVVAEKPFTAPLLNPDTAAESRLFYLGGILDRLVKENGKPKILETKTTTESISQDSPYWNRLLMDTQVSGYYLGATAIVGQEVEGCVYDVIRRPLLQPFKATLLDKRKYKADGSLYASQRDKDETPQEFFDRLIVEISSNPSDYFARREVPRSQDDLYDYLFDVWQTSQMIHAFKLKDKWPRFTNSCTSVYGLCRYFGICSKQVSADDPIHFKKVEQRHQEFERVK